ncbi:hypothetical protein Droror1_Dr00018058 [Drosera rotundifolia]
MASASDSVADITTMRPPGHQHHHHHQINQSYQSNKELKQQQQHNPTTTTVTVTAAIATTSRRMSVTEFIKACKEQIDVLTANISSEEANSKGWLASRNDSSNADMIAHKHGVLISEDIDTGEAWMTSKRLECSAETLGEHRNFRS